MPIATAVLTIREYVESNLPLHRQRVEDRAVLQLAQFLKRQTALGMGRAGI
jgi:hypothetical protein